MSSLLRFKIFRTALAAASLFAGATSLVHAGAVPGQGTWETTLEARYLTSVHAHGPDAYYDKSLNITWLADANYANTIGIAPNGEMQWADSVNWTKSVSIDGVTGWRLPQAKPVNGTDFQPLDPLEWVFDGSGDQGMNMITSKSEMVHMFYVTLGNIAQRGTDGSVNKVYGLANSGPFKNLTSYTYATSQDYGPSDKCVKCAWYFSFEDGGQFGIGQNGYSLSWLVHDGSVGTPAVPEPSEPLLVLFGALVVGLTAHPRSRLKRIAGSPTVHD